MSLSLPMVFRRRSIPIAIAIPTLMGFDSQPVVVGIGIGIGIGIETSFSDLSARSETWVHLPRGMIYWKR